jgi:hypothetical protein
MVAVLVAVYHIAPREAWAATPRDYWTVVTVHERIGKHGDTRYDQDRANALMEHLRKKGIQV